VVPLPRPSGLATSSESPAQGPAGAPWTGPLRFRLDVSQYYVIRTIIILDASVGGMGSLSSQRMTGNLLQYLHANCQAWLKPATGPVTLVERVSAGHSVQGAERSWSNSAKVP